MESKKNCLCDHLSPLPKTKTEKNNEALLSAQIYTALNIAKSKWLDNLISIILFSKLFAN